MAVKNIMIVGVGGQGTLLTSRILGGITTAAGYDVKLSEVHGMSQRGGSVVTYAQKLISFHSNRLYRRISLMIRLQNVRSVITSVIF